MCLLNCASVKDYLYNSENWLRSPFHLSNFVRLSSTSKILGFHSNWMENRFRVVLKKLLKRNRSWCLRDLQSKKSWSKGAFSMIYVEISDYELFTVWRGCKLKNKIWHSSHNRHIALLKRTPRQVKIRHSIHINETTRIHSERIIAVPPRFSTRNPIN